ncbi:ABC transporter ATP-binding protein [Lachnospiraceae bacterium MD1]|uniref:ABC transporter ATP-binding protein n=1 Tax=Variimorphobacter saccharofermentans TaxID=2755051 RepID=A0A839JWN7_9FIRM|nr:ABC transporter ATP-binding protein [Variimorphobacter saccharofermentans]MBB2182093.1 ABC transporter ATP-binding protein [Variimorphobacter saccharofermentans]
MLKLIKFLKKSSIALLIVIVLLVIQAYTDLALPSYTSDIVNVGIVKSGIDSGVPAVIRKTELDRMTLLMTEDEKQAILPHYTLINTSDLSQKELTEYEKKYPLISSEELYKWDGKDKELLSDNLIFPSTLLLFFESEEESSVQMQSKIYDSFPPGMIQEGTTIFDILPMLPEESRTQMIAGIREQLSKMPDMIIEQSAIAYVKAEYDAIGVNVHKMQTEYILTVGAKMIGLAFLGMLATILVSLLSSRIAAKMGRDLRKDVFQKVLSFSHKEMDQFSTASLITRSTNDIQNIQNMLVMLIRIVVYSPILAIGGIIKVLNTNTSMSWILILGVGALFLLIGLLMVIAMPKFKLIPKLTDRINLVTREILTGLPVIRAFSTVEHEEKRFDKANTDLTKNNLFVNRTMTIMMPAIMLIMNLIVVLIIWVGADKIDVGTMQLGDMIAFISYAMQIIISFLMLSLLSIMLPRASVSAARVDELLSTKISIQDPVEEAALNDKIKGVLEFRDVSFRYPNAEEDVLSNISFIAKPGQTTAIIGSTGSGKSTLINLIPRFYDATQGTILIDGTDITKIKQHKLREKLGFVPQKGVLFSGTIESNIKFGNPDIADEFMKKAARIAQAEEFINTKPEGYEASISEGGTNVSGGQKQRLSIARAIARNPEIYIFDDSFSALDYKTDAALRKTLKSELSDSTVIIVAQRISTIMNAEQILVLNDGRIVGKGTHKELLKNCEVYQQIAASQLSKEELAYE